MSNVWVVDNLRLPKQKIGIEDLKVQHMCDTDFSSTDDNDAAILIGVDFPQLHLYRDIKTGKDHESIAIQSTLGWVLLGGKDNNKKPYQAIPFKVSQALHSTKSLKNFGKLYRTEQSTKKLHPTFQRKNRAQGDCCGRTINLHQSITEI